VAVRRKIDNVDTTIETPKKESILKNYSVETLFDNITLKQSKSGYRHSIDPILVSHFAKPSAGDKVIDLGTGCGIIPILLADNISPLEIIGVEIQSSLAEFAKDNIMANNMSDDIKIINSDMKKIKSHIEPASVDMVITNPPYTKKNSGRINPDSERAIARHEIKITLAELVEIAAELLKDSGKFVIVYPKKRLSEVLAVMVSNGINPELLRLVHTKKDVAPKLFLLSGEKRGSKELVVAPPLYIFDESAVCIDGIAKMFQ